LRRSTERGECMSRRMSMSTNIMKWTTRKTSRHELTSSNHVRCQWWQSFYREDIRKDFRLIWGVTCVSCLRKF
jgi:hypothetical protein